jgi:hypothetical protein
MAANCLDGHESKAEAARGRNEFVRGVTTSCAVNHEEENRTIEFIFVLLL